MELTPIKESDFRKKLKVAESVINPKFKRQN